MVKDYNDFLFSNVLGGQAIEIADLDQKIKIIQELDGYIMQCVHDQNGNHVIQKCIRCVPEKHIQFIVESFFDQVALLSTHPYGCRVIQVNLLAALFIVHARFSVFNNFNIKYIFFFIMIEGSCAL